jgi:hypothetical protein
MPDATRWVKFRDDLRLSWHVAPPAIAPWIRTRCGRWAGESPLTADDLPLGAKSCETCLRLVAHDAERAEWAEVLLHPVAG